MSEPTHQLSLLPTDVEDDLRTSVRAVLQKLCPTDVLNGLYDGVAPGSVSSEVRSTVWGALAHDLGLAGLLVPESLGGAGATAREAAVVCEEIGRACAPGPFLTSAVISTTLLSAVGDTEYLPRLAAGEITAALLLPATAATAFAPGETIRSVVGLPADLLLLPVADGDRIALHALTPDAVTITPVTSLDMTRPVADVTITRPTTDATLLAPDAREALDHALLVGAGLLAAEQLGLADWALSTTVTYLKDRRQFGRVVGGFQALKHRLADLYAAVEGARAASSYAAATLGADAPGPAADAEGAIAVAVAQAYCSETAVRATEEAVQLHGGLGMTWEHPAHLHLKRAKADALLLGTAEHHRATLAALIDLTLQET